MKDSSKHLPSRHASRGHRNRHGSIGHLLAFHSDQWPAFSVENRIFSNPRVFNAPLRGFPLELVTPYTASRNYNDSSTRPRKRYVMS